jgi:RNA polymerase sigma factor (sigma-70 family)
MNISDATLLERWTADRDAEAFQELVSRHAGMVFATCLRILGNREDANDTAQACFIKLAERVRPTRESLTGLLHTMARRESYNLIKSSKRRQVREQTFSDAHTETTEITFDDVSTHVDDAIGSLPEKERAVIVAHFLEGRTHDSIAEELGIGRSTVSYRIGKGVERIRGSLAKQGITASATGLATAMATATAGAAPAGLVASVGKLAIAGTAGSATTAVATGGLFAMWKVVATSSVIAVAAGGGYLVAQSTKESPAQTTAQASTQSSATANNPISSAPTSPPTVAAAVETDSESDEDEITVSGTVVSAHGFPRPDIEFFNDWPFNPYSGSPTTDDDGRFSFAIESDALESWMLYSHNTQTATIISTDSLKSGDDLRIVMDMSLVDVVGRVVQSDGAPAKNTQVQFRLTAPDGAAHVSKEFTSNKLGLYSGRRLPSGDGWTIEARVIPSEPKTAGPWQVKTPLLADSWAIDLADITISGDAAPKIDENETASTPQYSANSKAYYGGVVKDSAGNPIEGVLLKLMFDTKNGMVDTGRARSDEQGKWQVSLPADLMRLTLRAQHLDFVPTVADPDFQNPPLARMQDRTSEFVMHPGTEIQGVVRNQRGDPVGDVLILGGNLYSRTAGGWERTANAPMEDLTTVRSDKDGRFRLGNLRATEARLQFLSYDYAPQIKKLIPSEIDGLLEVVLQDGGTIRGRIIDVAGNPLPGGYIYGREWVMDEQFPLNVRALADTDGMFALEHVPIEGTSSFSFGVRGLNGKRDRRFLGMSANALTPREEPYEITMFEPIMFSGRVIDADTGEPIKRYKVRNGWQLANQDRVRFISMSSPSRVRSDDGAFEKKLDGVHISYPPTTGFAVGIFADDYIPAMSPLVYLGDDIEPFEIRLQRGTPFKGRIVDGNGEPARAAKLVWIGPDETAFVQNGQLDNRFVGSPALEDRTLKNGKFEFPPSNDPGLILAVHAEGYAVVASSNFIHDGDISLLPWAKVEGMLHSEESEIARVQMKPLGDWDLESDPPIRWNFWDASHTDGRFEFAHVPAIPFEIGRLTVAARQAELSHGAYLTPDAGQSHHLVVGGDGAIVKGSIAIPDDVAFDPQHVRIAAKTLDAEGEIQPRYVPKVDSRGAFEIAGIPPGHYTLEAFYHAAPMPMVCGSGMLLAQGATEFVVPEGDGGPFQIGSVAMDVLDSPKIGSAVPDLAGWTFKEKEFSLDSWKGKFVVLDFWASWCPPCRAETPKLNELRNAYPSPTGIEFVGLNFDYNANAGKAFAETNELDWPQLSIGEWNPENVVLKEFGVTAIPSLWLIGPDGVVLGRDLNHDALRTMLDARVP